MRTIVKRSAAQDDGDLALYCFTEWEMRANYSHDRSRPTPHGEERRSRVSNHEGHQFANELRPRPSRRMASAMLLRMRAQQCCLLSLYKAEVARSTPRYEGSGGAELLSRLALLDRAAFQHFFQKATCMALF